MKSVIFLSLALILAACAQPRDSKTADEYLVWASKDAPRDNFPFTAERVEKRGPKLVTVLVMDATKMSVPELSRGLELNDEALLREFAAVCKSPYYDDMVGQGYSMIIEMTVINQEGTKVQEFNLKKKDCRDAGL